MEEGLNIGIDKNHYLHLEGRGNRLYFFVKDFNTQTIKYKSYKQIDKKVSEIQEIEDLLFRIEQYKAANNIR